MTIDEFAQHLGTQPWASAYITNLLAADTDFDSVITNYIGSAFSWVDTPEGLRFWNALHTNFYDLTGGHVYLLSDLLTVLPTYFPNNPEFFYLGTTYGHVLLYLHSHRFCLCLPNHPW